MTESLRRQDREEMGRFLLELVDECCALGEEVRRELAGRSVSKQDRSPVTVGDFAIQVLVAHRLRERFAEEPLLAEESSDLLRENSELRQSVRHFVERYIPGIREEQMLELLDRGAGSFSGEGWVLDPIDGTAGFLRGDQYAVALARLRDGKPAWGVLGCPRFAPRGRGDRDRPAGSIFLAVRGGGCRWYPWPEATSAEPIAARVSRNGDPGEAILARSVEERHTDSGGIQALLRELGTGVHPVKLDSQVKYAAVACGEVDFLIRLLSPDRPNYREKIWDHAAGALVVEESGGRVTDLDGRPLDFGLGARLERNRGLVASNGRLHEAVVAAVAALGL